MGDVVRDGDRCVIGLNGIYKTMQVKAGKTASYEKHKFEWDNCIGHAWGKTWKIVRQKLEPLSAEEANGESVVSKVLADVDAGEDNRNARDRAQKGQGLKREDIMNMKGTKQGTRQALKSRTVKRSPKFDPNRKFG